MAYLDVGMQGWYKVSFTFKVIAKQQREDSEVFKCVDGEGNEFFIENSDIFAKYARNSSAFEKTVEESLGDVIYKMQHTKGVFEVSFNKVDGENRVLRGYTLGPDEDFGYTLVHDLDAKGERNVNNRGIQYLILNNTKYIVK
jgi:hypothetical protein